MQMILMILIIHDLNYFRVQKKSLLIKVLDINTEKMKVGKLVDAYFRSAFLQD